MTSERPLVLVIDDDSDSRDAMRVLLTDAGFDVLEAVDGEAALHYLTSKKTEPVLIVTDLAMPDLSGWELINVLHSSARLSTIPLLVVSGVELKDRPVRDEGVLEFFPKPLDTARFLDAVRRHAVTGEQREARRVAATRRLQYSPFSS